MLSGLVAGSGERENFAALIKRNLRNQMRGIAKTVDTEPACFTRFAERTIAQHPSTEQRGNIDIIVFVRQMKTKARISDCKLGVAAIDRITGELGTVAKIFTVGSTISAFAIRPPEPGNADALADFKSADAIANLFDACDDLMPKNQR